MRRGGAITALALLLAQPASAQELPDWSGVWELVGGTLFDRATAEPPDARAGDPGARERPPYNAEWEAKYLANIEKVAQDRFPDPITGCGVPVGFPRVMQVVDGYEFVVTPRQTWILTENGPNIVRIYTDGRDHPPEDELWNTYTGHSVGRWEGGTLKFDTVALNGVGKVILSRAGVVMSDKLTVKTSVHEDPATRLLVFDLVLEDPVALTRPWPVRVTFERFPPGTNMWDYACAENNRNPVDENGWTQTLDTEGKVIDVAPGQD